MCVNLEYFELKEEGFVQGMAKETKRMTRTEISLKSPPSSLSFRG